MDDGEGIELDLENPSTPLTMEVDLIITLISL